MGKDIFFLARFYAALHRIPLLGAYVLYLTPIRAPDPPWELYKSDRFVTLCDTLCYGRQDCNRYFLHTPSCCCKELGSDIARVS